MRITGFFEGTVPMYARPVFGEWHQPNVYPRKSNFSSGSLQTRVFVSFTVSFNPVMSASQIAPAVLPISSSIVIPLPSHNLHCANAHAIFDQTKRVRPAPVSQI